LIKVTLIVVTHTYIHLVVTPIRLRTSLWLFIYVNQMYTRQEALKLEYPYLWTGDDGLQEAFELLKHSDLDIHQDYPYSIDNTLTCGYNKWVGKGRVIVTSQWNVTDRLSSYFNENVRVKCKREDERISPYDYWKQNKHTLVPKEGATAFDLNTAVWDKIKGCGMFRPYLMTGWIKKLNATSVLDFSSGWGDRLLGAIAVGGVRYVGVDPNINLVQSYQVMIDTFAEDSSLYTMIAEPFQTCILPEGEVYDMVFTSPPYFNLEIYSRDDTQSYSKGDSLNMWLTTFLFPSLDKAWSVLAIGGVMIIVINDTKYAHYVDTMIDYMKTITDSSAVTMIPYSGGNNKPQPMWIWAKLEESNNEAITPIAKYVKYVADREVVYQCDPDDGTLAELDETCTKYDKQLTVFVTGSLDYEVNAIVHVVGSELEAKKYQARTPHSTYFGSSDPIYQYLLAKTQ